MLWRLRVIECSGRDLIRLGALDALPDMSLVTCTDMPGQPACPVLAIGQSPRSLCLPKNDISRLLIPMHAGRAHAFAETKYRQDILCTRCGARWPWGARFALSRSTCLGSEEAERTRRLEKGPRTAYCQKWAHTGTAPAFECPFLSSMQLHHQV